MPDPKPILPIHQAYRQHTRKWRENTYCYPVISRRSKGLSIGVNLNPDKACNFDCIYCQVDRRTPGPTRIVEISAIGSELNDLLDLVADQTLFADGPFDALPVEQRIVRDIAFSGDGEPTTYPKFDEAVELVAQTKRRRGLDAVKIVLITDACYLKKPVVQRGLAIMDENNGEIWAKLDAGTEEYYRLVNRPNYPLAHVIENIVDAAKVRPIVIQSLWMNVHGQPPPNAEVLAFCDRLDEIVKAGGKIKLVQVYTIARQTAEPYATVLKADALNQIAATVSERTGLAVETFGGVEQ
jgi:wyosine [tRNA(Phe)-imidazoG37] synthetase (radical SAM superfamily)